ncbi:MAG: SUMF1/EgtB/PvdO family nonheme iron enzyme [Bradymonadales bacterium]|jgi:formylglycine-generating enzyme required for sulfatase activity
MRFYASLAAAIGILAVFSACEGLFDSECLEPEAGMVLIRGSEIDQIGADYYIDSYEASRSSATATEQGTFMGRACNYANTMPWSNISYNDANIACRDAGKRLCTQAEWSYACASLQLNAYPYGPSYIQGACNDGGATVHASGVNSACKTALNVYDLSGNLREWVQEGTRMGGSYNANANELGCGSALTSPDHITAVPQPSDGFRCCRDAF